VKGKSFKSGQLEKIFTGKSEPEELKKLVNLLHSKAPKLLRVGGRTGEQGFLFNSLVLSFYQGDETLDKLASSLDINSLFRLSVAAGGESIQVPMVEHLVKKYVLLLGLSAIRNGSQNRYRIFRLCTNYLSDLGIEPWTYKEFKESLFLTKQATLIELLKIQPETQKPIIDELRDVLDNLSQVADNYSDKLSRTSLNSSIIGFCVSG